MRLGIPVQSCNPVYFVYSTVLCTIASNYEYSTVRCRMPVQSTESTVLRTVQDAIRADLTGMNLYKYGNLLPSTLACICGRTVRPCRAACVELALARAGLAVHWRGWRVLMSEHACSYHRGLLYPQGAAGWLIA